MKKGLIVLIAILLTAVLAVSLASCADYDDEGRIRLKTPSLTVNGNAVTWSSVKNAEKYGVVINDDEANEITVTGTSYTVTAGGTNNVKVRAIGDLKKYGYSDYSDNASVVTAGKLATPQMNDAVINDDGSATFTWSSVEGAKAYRLEVKSEGTTLVNEDVEGNEYTLEAEKLSAPAYYSYRVKAISAGDDADSEYSAAKNYSKSITLAAPAEPKQSARFDSIEFKAPEYANRYTVEAYNDDIAVKYTVNASKDVSIRLENIPIETPGEYKVRVRAENSSNNLCAPSEFVEVMKNDGVTPLTLTLYDAPKNIMLDGSMLSWSGVADGVKYVLSYVSGKNTTTTDDTKSTEFDLSSSTRIKASGFAGLLVDVTVYVGKNLENGVLDGLKGDAISYTYSEKPDLIEEGEFNGYYAVDSIAKLNYIATEPDKKYVLTKNIDCANGIITPIAGEFKGVLDGNNYSLNRFTLQLKKGDSRTYVSLFGDVAADAEIKNLGLFGASITINETEAVSAAILCRTNHGKLTNINVKAEITAQNNAAAIAVENKGTIKDAFFSGVVTGNNKVGAITALNSGSIFNARVFTSTLTASASSSHQEDVYLGGIAGENTGSIKHAGLDGTAMSAATHVKTRNVYSGGIAGRNAGSISTAYVNSNGKTIKTITNAGGNASKAYSGGIAGVMSSGSIADSYAIYGTYISADYASALVGEMRGASSISDSYTAAVTLSSHNNYIVSAVTDENAAYRNLYYFNTTDHELTPNVNEMNAVTRIGNRADMDKASIASMSKVTKSDKLSQAEFMTLNDMLYYESGAGYVNNLSKSAITSRVPGKVYGGDKTSAGEPKKFDSSNIASNVTTYDIYSRTLADGTVLTLTKTFKIN